MRTFAIAIVLAVVALFVFGTPFSTERPERVSRWQSAAALLPMSFAHEDHASENCILCHHNYVDDTGGDPCMYCHVTNPDVYPELEQHFHDLCRGCHEDKEREGETGGPVRACVECHVEEDLP